MKILSMSGFVPEHICDTIRFTRYAGDNNISHYCGYASDFVSQVMMDDQIGGAVYPKSCDSARIITSYLSNCGKFWYQLNVPVFGTTGAEDYFASSIREYKKAIEKHYGISLEDVVNRSELVNVRNHEIKKTYDNLEKYSYSDYLMRIHKMLQLPLADQKWEENSIIKTFTKKPVFIVGSFLSNPAIPMVIEQAGLKVVGDNLPESGRLVSTAPVNTSGEIYHEIAKSILSARLSPTQDSFREIIKTDLNEIRKKSVCGVIFVLQKYCEPYEYLYNIYKPQLDSLGIKSLKLSVNGTNDDRKVALSVEAFADSL